MENIQNWSKKALCRTLPESEAQSLFFESKNYPEARRFCIGGCPVVDSCYLYAVAHGEEGIWGGTSPKERDKLGLAFQSMIRNYLRIHGALEYRAPLEWLSKREQEQLLERGDPIVQSRVYQESTTDQAS